MTWERRKNGLSDMGEEERECDMGEEERGLRRGCDMGGEERFEEGV